MKICIYLTLFFIPAVVYSSNGCYNFGYRQIETSDDDSDSSDTSFVEDPLFLSTIEERTKEAVELVLEMYEEIDRTLRRQPRYQYEMGLMPWPPEEFVECLVRIRRCRIEACLLINQLVLRNQPEEQRQQTGTLLRPAELESHLYDLIRYEEEAVSFFRQIQRLGPRLVNNLVDNRQSESGATAQR